MDWLDRLLGHDEWTTGLLLQRCRELTPDQLTHSFDIGHGGVLVTLEHMIGNVEAWTDLMAGTIGADQDTPSEHSIETLIRRHKASYARFATLARQIRDAGKVNDRWMDVLDQPPTEKTYGGAILHVITHNMHHRGEVLHMLARLGLRNLPEGDLLGWEQQHG